MSVEVEKVSKLYGSQRALDNVSFIINAGQVVGLLDITEPENLP